MFLTIILYLASFGLIVGSIAAFVVFLKIGRTAKVAGVIPEPLIVNGQIIGTGILLALNFLLITSITGRDENSQRFAAVGHEVNSLRADNSAIRKDHQVLKPLATNAAALLDMDSRIKNAEANANKALTQIDQFSAETTNALSKAFTQMYRHLDERFTALKTPSAQERTASMAPPTPRDGRFVSLDLPPMPELLQPAPRAATPPPAPAPVAATPAPQPAAPQIHYVQTDSSELAKVEHRLAQLERARQDAKRAQKNAKAIQKVAFDKGSQAEQVALLAMKQVTELNVRQSKMDDRLTDMSKAIDKVLAFMISTNVSLPAMIDTNPPVAQTPAAQTAAQAAPPVPAPAPVAAVPAPQLAPAPSVVQPANTNAVVYFTVTNTLPVGRSLFQVQRFPWEKGGDITYEVTGEAKPGDNLAAAREIVHTTSERFHKDNGVWFAGKDPASTEVKIKLIKEFGKALDTVRKGNPGWEHLKIQPVFRTNQHGGATSTNAVTRADNTQQASTAAR